MPWYEWRFVNKRGASSESMLFVGAAERGIVNIRATSNVMIIVFIA